ncbi:MAG TPA: response regulator [Bacteroidota bacterium]|nr:response regulator [Bacteroidota bacterium]
MENEAIRILLIEDNKDFAKLLQVYLQRFEKDRFNVIWKENYAEAMTEIDTNPDLDVVLMDYFLPGKSGLDITKELLEKQIQLPIIFLTVNRDFEVVLKVMKLGVADYIVKEEVSSPMLPKTIINVLQKKRLQDQLTKVEVSKHRVSVMREMLAGVLNDLERPLLEMRAVTDRLKTIHAESAQKNYVKIIDDNIHRITDKLEKLKVLKQDKTVQYIKDIRMIDLS